MPASTHAERFVARATLFAVAAAALLTALSLGLDAPDRAHAVTEAQADLNDDSSVNVLDLLIVSSMEMPVADVDANGTANVMDLFHVASFMAPPQTTPSPTVTPTRTPTRTSTPTRTPTVTPSPTIPPGGRNKYLQPFASDSPWNMPIGNMAQYVPAGIQRTYGANGIISTDVEEIGVNPADPLKPLNGGDLVHVPPALSHNGSWNGCATFLRADNNTIWQGQPLNLSPGGAPSWGFTWPTTAVDLRGQGLLGCHGGSGLSGVGGTLRTGEAGTTIRHALKINLHAQRFIACCTYRWPAIRVDGYASPDRYGGTVPALKMGALLALRPEYNCSAVASLNARSLCRALQDYGGYVVDDTTWDAHGISVEEGAAFSDGGSFHDDMQNIFIALHVVDNNGATSIGGGGTPRKPLLPPISN